MDSFIIATLALCSLTAPAYGDKGSSKARSCSDFRQFYGTKPFSTDDVPQSEISGEHLRICSQGYTCCTSIIEDNLATLSVKEVDGILRESRRSLLTSLNGQQKAFDGFVRELLNRSISNLKDTFTSTWGSLYSENSQVFSDLYKDLMDYYAGNSANLEEVLSDFWTKLLERIFYQTNKQSSIGEDYLECVSKQMETLRPFGDAPHKMAAQVTRTFVAARSFIQGLSSSVNVVRIVGQVKLNQVCAKAIMKMTYCARCETMSSAMPCSNYCINVMKGCLANQADLNTEWTHLGVTMVEVAEHRLNDMDSVILSLPNHIAEAMFTMMENIGTINSKLFQACGNLRGGEVSSTGDGEIMKRGSMTVEDRLGDTSNRMEKLISDVTTRLRGMRSYWVSLPNLLCSDRVAIGAGAEDMCWNGGSRARYLPEAIGDGLANQINNPEVELDITKPDKTIRQQIMQLKIRTHNLRNALIGRDTDFQDTSDDVSGSGSGVCTDESCLPGPRLAAPSTDRPIHYAYPPETKKDKSSAQRALPSNTIYLLSLLLLLLRR
uniref:Glypican-1 n=1 Tax=Nothobranchius pienaari TaxID=704102 RepID=A0A1A8M5B6_9TELE